MAIPEKFKNLANAVRNEIYGRDVRESIAKSIEETGASSETAIKITEQLIDGSFDEGVLNTEIERKLNELEEEYAPELSSVRSQLEQASEEIGNKADKNKVNELAYDKADKTYVDYQLSAKRDKSPVDLDEMTPRTLAAIQGGDETSFNLLSIPRNDSVLPEKTTFITGGKNKYTGIPISGFAVQNDGTVTAAASGNSYMAVVPIEATKTYTTTKRSGGNRFRVALVEKHPWETEMPMESLYFYNGSTAGAIQSHTFTNDVNAKYVIVFTNSDLAEVPNVQVEEGEDSTDYEPYYPRLFGNEIITSGNVQERVRSDINFGKLVHPMGAINFNTNTGVITFGEGIELVVFKNDKTSPTKVAIPPQQWTNITPGYFSWKYVIYYRHSEGLVGFTRFSNFSLNDEDIYIGTLQYRGANNKIEITGLENYYVDGGIPRGSRETDPQGSYFLLDDIEGVYYAPDGIEGGESGTNLDLQRSSHTIVYDIYDNLVDRYPDYIKKEYLGDDESSLPIYQYSFLPMKIENPTSHRERIPKIVIISAIHGYEQASAWCLAKFFEHLCFDYQNNDILKFMRWNIEFVVVPVANPWGYDNNSRFNFNGVDLNRNFPEEWQETDDDATYPSGSGPASEAETQILINVMRDHPDSNWLIDFHNRVSGYPLFYIQDQTAATVASSLYRTITRKWKETYEEAPQDDTVFGYVRQSGRTGRLTTYAQSIGYTALTYETTWQIPFGEEKYDQITLETGVDLTGNLLTQICKSFK